MKYRTRVVELARRGRRASMENRATIIVASRSADAPFDFRRLFCAHYARIRATCLDFAEPGVAVFAFSLEDGAWQGSMCLAARPGEVRAGVIGRHSEADLPLGGDPSLALRHLLFLVEPGTLAGALRGEVRFRVLDLETGSPPRDEEGRPVSALTAEGPVFLTCPGFALLALTTGDPTDWPDSARDAWDCLPERVFVEERLARGSAPRPMPRLPAAPARGRRSTVVTLVDGPSHIEYAALAGGEPPAGHLVLDSGGDQSRVPVGQGTLSRGLLIGRYARCHVNAGAAIADIRVSRVHLLLIDVAGQLLAIDLASSNGSYLLGAGLAPVVGFRAAAFNPGEVIALADFTTVIAWRLL
jgi:hypothetical protein